MRAGPILRNARQAAGLTQAEVAARARTSQPAIARLERADTNPTFTTFVEVLHATGHDLVLRRSRSRLAFDEGQIIERLKMSPADRLSVFMASQRNVARVVAKSRRLDASPP